MRDFYSRYCLGIAILGNQSGAAVQKAMKRLFVRYAGHEQMHRIFKADLKPCRTMAGQQNAASRWVKYSNTERPHEGIGQRMPAELYEQSARRFQEPGKQLMYPADWAQRRVRLNGDIRWAGRTRHVGRVFIGQWVGLKEKEPSHSEVYFARQLIGEIHRDDPGGMRPARWVYKKEGESARASPAQSVTYVVRPTRTPMLLDFTKSPPPVFPRSRSVISSRWHHCFCTCFTGRLAGTIFHPSKETTSGVLERVSGTSIDSARLAPGGSEK